MPVLQCCFAALLRDLLMARIHTGQFVAMLLILLGTLHLSLPATHAQPAGGTVLVVEVHDVVDLGLAPYLARVLRQAENEQAEAVILEINTPGGRLDAALQIRDTLLASPVRTIAYVNREALSAGALIAISAQEIYMAPGGVMGAATPVDGAGEPADQKVISAVRSIFKATAEQRERDPVVAEAMVDPAVEIEGLVASGQLLTLTTTEAVTWGYADGVAADRQALLTQAGLTAAAVMAVEPSPAEVVVRFLTNPVMASLLFSVGILGILATLFTGEVGLLTGVGIVLLAAFFWGHFLVGLTGWEGVALVVLGLVLLAVEVFVIPGFGVAGILGLVALLGGLYLSVTDREIVTPAALEQAVLTVASAFVLMVAGGALMIWLLPAVSRTRGLVLQAYVGQAPDEHEPRARAEGRKPVARRSAPAAVGRTHEWDARPSLVGARGRALSDLRPAGFATIAGERVDVITRGDFIPAGEEIEVVLDEGYRRVVRRATPEANGSGGSP